MRALVWTIPLLLLAGCAQLDDAKEAAADAQTKLDEARREAQEAKDRYDRVKSATVVRTEVVHLVVTPESNETEVWFLVNATRSDGTLIAPANVTGVSDIAVSGAAWRFSCDPLTCRVQRSGEDVTLGWADGAAGSLVLTDGHARCEPASAGASACALPGLTRARGEALVTTAVGDITE